MRNSCTVVFPSAVVGLFVLAGAAMPLMADDGGGPRERFAFFTTAQRDEAVKVQLRAVLPQATRSAALGRMFPVQRELFNTPEFAARMEEAEQRFLVSRVSLDSYARLAPKYQHALRVASAARLRGDAPTAFCFTPGTDPEVVQAFQDVVFGELPAFQLTNRWSTTATNGASTGGQGGQITLTYSFAPDGTQIPDGGFGAGPSDLQLRLRTIYGTDAAWQQIYHDVFNSWTTFSGISYVFETNDDGVQLGTNAGVVGTRGDVRLAGKPLDGNSGVLAYNNFPNNGDMVVDSTDSFYTNVNSNSIRLRNVLFHEHGHGIGLLHVCPRTNTKLMEPFISTSFFGPQFDDILSAQRHYGDNLEPNDSALAPTPITDAGTTTRTVRTVSIDDNSDQDWYAVSMVGPATLVATVRPAGTTYLQGPQTSACDVGTDFNPATVNDLTVQILNSQGTVVLGQGNAGAAGSPETASGGIVGTGTLFIRVTGGTADNIQPYELDYRTRAGLIEVVFPNGTPTEVVPGETSSFAVDIRVTGDVVPAGPRLMTRANSSESFTSTILSSNGSDPGGFTHFTATLPAFRCEDSPEYFVTLTGNVSGTVNAPITPVVAQVGQATLVLSDNADTNLGWTLGGVAGDTATSGRWVRGDPNGTAVGGVAVSPEDDNSAIGAFCFHTGQGTAGGATGEADVDGGRTTLLSPIFNLSGSFASNISFARWYSNSRGAAPNADVFTIDISNNAGSTWTNVRTIGPTGAGTDGGWVLDSFDPATFVPLTANMRLRFIAEDAGSGSLVEAAIDDVVITGTNCVNPPTCPGDFNNDGVTEPGDLDEFITAYFSGVPAETARCDFNNDGVTEPGDLDEFITAFFEGCN
ncbi:MAG: matrixin family metalloprotease [Phycisphaerales bacterium]